jgi:murein L,D-transpeptidase YcbB/YkuD
MQLLADAPAFGLLPAFYGFDSLAPAVGGIKPTDGPGDPVHLAQLDVAVTAALLQLMGQLHGGRLDAATFRILAHEDWVRTEGVARLTNALAGRNFRETLLGCQPGHRAYRELQAALTAFVGQHPGGLSARPVSAFRGDSTDGVLAAQRLREQGYPRTPVALVASGSHEDGLAAALRQFQRENGLEPDGKLGRRTKAALARTPQDRFVQLALNLDRLRQDPPGDSTYLLITLPAFTLQVFEAGMPVQTHRVIIGKADMPTPTLSSRITHFVIAPEWNVPYSIATREMLPRIKADPAYLAQNNLAVYDARNAPVDPSAVAWHTLSETHFPYLLKQLPGCDNALGNLLFYFPNPYSIYLHDTPGRGAFNATHRALSHGCIRVENPLGLARKLLQLDHRGELPASPGAAAGPAPAARAGAHPLRDQRRARKRPLLVPRRVRPRRCHDGGFRENSTLIGYDDYDCMIK